VNYLIDTNIISEVRKGERCDSHVAAWFASIDDHDIYLSDHTDLARRNVGTRQLA
jgi:toxin FitB